MSIFRHSSSLLNVIEEILFYQIIIKFPVYTLILRKIKKRRKGSLTMTNTLQIISYVNDNFLNIKRKERAEYC